MIETEYGIRKALETLPSRDLLKVPHKDTILTVSHPAFGPGTHQDNIEKMQKGYTFLPAYARINFKPLTTDKSISSAAYDFPNLAKRQIFRLSWLQIGYALLTKARIIVNPLDENGKPTWDVKYLNSLLKSTQKIPVNKGHIRLGPNGLASATYTSFQTGDQDAETFANGGLARILEHTEGKATKLAEIASLENYQKGVNVWRRFNSINKPILRFVGLGPREPPFGDLGKFNVGGDFWYDCSDDGYAFGGLVTGEASA